MMLSDARGHCQRRHRHRGMRSGSACSSHEGEIGRREVTKGISVASRLSSGEPAEGSHMRNDPSMGEMPASVGAVSFGRQRPVFPTFESLLLP